MTSANSAYDDPSQWQYWRGVERNPLAASSEEVVDYVSMQVQDKMAVFEEAEMKHLDVVEELVEGDPEQTRTAMEVERAKLYQAIYTVMIRDGHQPLLRPERGPRRDA